MKTAVIEEQILKNRENRAPLTDNMSMNFASKRKRDETEPDSKKVKNYINEKERQEFSTSNEWPVYSHPEGGMVKITPWGSLRQYVDGNGATVTKFEDVNFQDISFGGAAVAEVYEMPSTPQSLNQSNNNFSSLPSNMDSDIKLSPGDEAEHYVISGYEKHKSNNPNQFQQEHENYFGMDDRDMEYDDMHRI